MAPGASIHKLTQPTVQPHWTYGLVFDSYGCRSERADGDESTLRDGVHTKKSFHNCIPKFSLTLPRTGGGAGADDSTGGGGAARAGEEVVGGAEDADGGGEAGDVGVEPRRHLHHLHPRHPATELLRGCDDGLVLPLALGSDQDQRRGDGGGVEDLRSIGK